jgi:hypothetical protein
MSEFWKALHQPEYLHVLLNHLPVTGLGIATLSLLISLIVKNRVSIMISLALIFLCALSAWPVVLTGDKGYDNVYAVADDDGEAYLDHHMELGERWSKMFYATSLIAAAAFFVFWGSPKYGTVFAWIVLVMALISIGAGAVIAETGGRVRHKEFRTGPPPHHSE